jgi:hypothetical protein
MFSYYCKLIKTAIKADGLDLLKTIDNNEDLAKALLEIFFPVALQSLKDLGRLTYRRFLELVRHMVGLLGRVISPSQGLYLHRTTQHRKTRTNIHALSGIRTHYLRNQPAKTHASDRTATVTGHFLKYISKLEGMINQLPKLKLERKLLRGHSLLHKPLLTTFPVLLTHPLLFMLRTCPSDCTSSYFLNTRISLIQALSEPLVVSERRNAPNQMKYLILL